LHDRDRERSILERWTKVAPMPVGTSGMRFTCPDDWEGDTGKDCAYSYICMKRGNLIQFFFFFLREKFVISLRSLGSMEEARRVKGKEKMKEEDDRQETQTKERREPNDSDGTDHSFSHDTQLNWTAVLLGLGLKKDASMYHRLFQEHRIDSLAVLAALSKEDLKNCGIRLGHLPVFADLIDHYEQKKAEALRKSYMSPSSGDNSSLVEERAISILSRLKGVIRQVVHGLIDREVPPVFLPIFLYYLSLPPPPKTNRFKLS